MRAFKASVVAACELPELGTYLVALAEKPDGGGERLEIQKALAFDERDRALGMDTYCLCTEAGTAYGGVTRWTLTADVLEVVLNEKAAAALGVRGGFRVELPPGDRQALQAGLERVLG
jgi:hypothetical protein